MEVTRSARIRENKVVGCLVAHFIVILRTAGGIGIILWLIASAGPVFLACSGGVALLATAVSPKTAFNILWAMGFAAWPLSLVALVGNAALVVWFDWIAVVAVLLEIAERK